MSDSLAEKILRDSGILNPSEINDLKAEVKSTHVPLADLILKRKILSEEKLAKLYSEEIGMPYVKLFTAELSPTYLSLVPEHIARRYRAIVFDVEPDDTKLVATDNQLSDEAKELLTKLLGYNYKLFLASSSHLHSALDVYRDLGVNHPSVVDRSVRDNPVESADDPRIYKTVQFIIEQAIARKANVVHIEPGEDLLSVRFRVDGQLKQAYKLPIGILPPLLERIKLLAGLRPDIMNSQEGRFRVESTKGTFSLDVASLPTTDGEKITVHLRSEAALVPSLSSLGLWGRNLESVRHAMTQNRGLVLAAGSRDSGQSSTLYSLLSTLNTGRINAVTIEDRLSYKLNGVTQVELNRIVPTYEVAIESSLKQDPEALLIGNVMTPLSANLCFNSASNCLVLASINSQDAFASLFFLNRLGIEPYKIASAVHLVIAQKLVRKLCDNCKESIHPTNEILRALVKALGLASFGSIKDLHLLERKAAEAGIGGDVKKFGLSTSETSIKRLWQASEHGCVHCDYTGYNGRIGLQEVLEVGDQIKAKVANDIDLPEIHKLAIKAGFIPLGIDGLVKALRGLTSIEEILSYI